MKSLKFAKHHFRGKSSVISENSEVDFTPCLVSLLEIAAHPSWGLCERCYFSINSNPLRVLRFTSGLRVTNKCRTDDKNFQSIVKLFPLKTIITVLLLKKSQFKFIRFFDFLKSYSFDIPLFNKLKTSKSPQNFYTIDKISLWIFNSIIIVLPRFIKKQPG